MKKLLLFAAAAAMALSASAELTLTKVWEQAAQGSTANQRQATVINGTFYVSEIAFSATDPAGREKVLKVTENGYAETSIPTTSSGITYDQAGHLVIANNTFPNQWGDEGIMIQVYDPVTEELLKEYPMAPDLAGDAVGRTDILGICQGDMTEDGVLYLSGNKSAGNIGVFTVSGGEVNEDDSFIMVAANVGNTTQSLNHYYVNASGEEKLLHVTRNAAPRIGDLPSEVFVSEGLTLPGKGASCGAFPFVWNQKDYILYPGLPNYQNAWVISEMGAEEPTYSFESTVSANPNASQSNWLYAQVDDNNDLYIYQYVPGLAATCWKLAEEQTGPETMNLVGSMTNNWDINNPEAMTKTDDGVFTITKEFAVGDEMKFVITPGSWDDANVFGADSNGAFELSENYIGGQDLALAQPGQNFKVMVAGEYEVVVDPVNMKAYFTKSETPVVDELYIVGNFSGEAPGWDITQAEAMTAEDGKFTITKTFAAGDEFKLVGEKNWNDATTFGGQDDNNVGYFKVDDFLGGNITMVNPGANFKVEAAGEYKLVADKENKVLVVTGLNIPITDIVVPEQVTIALGGETYQIEAQVVPATATEGLTYTSSDEQVVTVDNTGLVTAVKSGTWEVAFRAPGIKEVQPATATVTVAADAVNATAAPVSKDIAFTVTNPTGVKNIGVAKTVASKKYVNAAGMVSDKAFDGMNIIVTTYSDGSRAVEKVVK